eukprot:TRINITY_DN1655_c0_g1_i1.p1 TRINITY_DN1655_c0_g1~~TRINITY_DN1655_c0_g1_i1.p1  ORF type:complete len:278 (-),score=93.11 TRINITY_DN1655_c0_g1_i1:39-872(-)
MSERKVINKYYPPDFDPAKVPRGHGPKGGQFTVRMMLPMSVRCTTCGEYLYRGKKFNSKKETVMGEEYLGIKIYRFYMRCTNCSSEFTIKTDPENSDYVADAGCSRNFEPWKDKDALIEQVKAKRKNEEEGDAMKALENRTMDSKIEADIIEALDEIKSLNAKNAAITSDTLLEHHKRTYEQMQKSLEKEDEAELKDVVFKNSNMFIKRIEKEEPKPKLQKTEQKDNVSLNILPKNEKKKEPVKKNVGMIKLMPKVIVKPKEEPKEEENALASLFDY